MVPTGVTSDTVSEGGKIFAALLGSGEVRRWDGSGDGLRQSGIADSASEWDAGLREVVADGRNGAQVNDDGRDVFVGQGTEGKVPHLRMEDASVVADAFTDGAGDHVIGPATVSGGSVGGDVGSDEPWAIVVGEDVTCTFLAGSGRSAGRVPVAIGVTTKAGEDSFGKVFAALLALGSRREMDIAQRTAARSGDVGVPCVGIEDPADKETGQDEDDEEEQEERDPKQTFRTGLHTVREIISHGEASKDRAYCRL